MTDTDNTQANQPTKNNYFIPLVLILISAIVIVATFYSKKESSATVLAKPVTQSDAHSQKTIPTSPTLQNARINASAVADSSADNNIKVTTSPKIPVSNTDMAENKPENRTTTTQQNKPTPSPTKTQPSAAKVTADNESSTPPLHQNKNQNKGQSATAKQDKTASSLSPAPTKNTAISTNTIQAAPGTTQNRETTAVAQTTENHPAPTLIAQAETTPVETKTTTSQKPAVQKQNMEVKTSATTKKAENFQQSSNTVKTPGISRHRMPQITPPRDVLLHQHPGFRQQSAKAEPFAHSMRPYPPFTPPVYRSNPRFNSRINPPFSANFNPGRSQAYQPWQNHIIRQSQHRYSTVEPTRQRTPQANFTSAPNRQQKRLQTYSETMQLQRKKLIQKIRKYQQDIDIRIKHELQQQINHLEKIRKMQQRALRYASMERQQMIRQMHKMDKHFKQLEARFKQAEFSQKTQQSKPEPTNPPGNPEKNLSRQPDSAMTGS